MAYLPNLIFGLMLVGALALFVRNINRIRKNIALGRPMDRNDQKAARWKNMARIALGQSKMVTKPIAGLLHLVVYIGFLFINIELLEIVLDGLLGSHRLFAPILGNFYNVSIAAFEWFALGVLVVVVIFWCRRNVLRIQRFWKAEMQGWPKWDADLILYFEVLLMSLFLLMNATDLSLQLRGVEAYPQVGSFPISQILLPLFEGLPTPTLISLERTFWWMHIVGIFGFLNYLYYSKHLHILLAFPNTYFANLAPKGAFANNPVVTQEVKLMLDPNADPYATPVNDTAANQKFGASEVTDLHWVQLLNAYTCTECGRCTSQCPANLTGKKLSPRKIMMDTRDRLTEVAAHLRQTKSTEITDGKQLLGDYITPEELWACTSCNACVEACPVDIDPLSIIMDMRQYLVMEQSAAPTALNNMMGNIENNGAPWPFNSQDRMQWTQL